MKIMTLLFGLSLVVSTAAQRKLNTYDYVYKQKDIVDYVVQKNGKYGIFHNHKELLPTIYDSVGVQKGPTPIVIRNEGKYSVFVAGDDLKLHSTAETYEEFHAGSTFSVGENKGVLYYLYSGKDLRMKKINARSSIEEKYLLNTQKPVILVNVDNNKKQALQADTMDQELVVSYPYLLVGVNHAQRFTVFDVNTLQCYLKASESNRSVELVKLYKGGNSASPQVKLFLKVRDTSAESIYHLAYESIFHSEKDADGTWSFTYISDFQYLTSTPVNADEQLTLHFFSESPLYLQIDKKDTVTNAITNVGYVGGLTSDEPTFITFQPDTERIYYWGSGRKWGMGLFWWGAK